MEFNLPAVAEVPELENRNDVPGNTEPLSNFVGRNNRKTREKTDKTIASWRNDRRKGEQTMNRNILKIINHTVSEPVVSTSVPAKKSGQRKTGSPCTGKTEVSESKAWEKMDVQLSNEQVALRAYFIGEHRRKLGFPGDETSDWVEARREISEELKGLVKELAAASACLALNANSAEV